ncbi:transient receptor potential cation channel protein painless-like isoform X2 [Oratosquilla oratoria]|uniref:transient receptor potential cation channel protein painless-like isoform X2 n=1 Tax=Oratosquilla oratoria TaxID=337810 RepID=UPI003F757BAA
MPNNGSNDNNNTNDEGDRSGTNPTIENNGKITAPNAGTNKKDSHNANAKPNAGVNQNTKNINVTNAFNDFKSLNPFSGGRWAIQRHNLKLLTVDMKGRTMMADDNQKAHLMTLIDVDDAVPSPATVRQIIEKNDATKLQDLLKGAATRDSVWYHREKDFRGHLHYAASKGATACLNTLLQYIPDKVLVDLVDDGGKTPLMVAVEAGVPSAVEALLNNGADPNKRDNGYNTPLHFVVRKLDPSGRNNNQEDYLSILDKILTRSNLDLEPKNATGCTPLLSAAEKLPVLQGPNAQAAGLVKLARKLVGMGASLEAHAVAKSKTVRELLEERGALTEVVMTERHSPQPRPRYSMIQDVFVYEGDADEVATLLEGAQTNEAKDIVNGWLGSKPLLHRAVDTGSPKMVQLLLHHGAEAKMEDLHGQMPIHRAAYMGNREILVSLIEDMKGGSPKLNLKSSSAVILSQLLKGYKKKTSHQQGVDHLACLKRLLESDIVIDVNSRTEDGYAMIHIAAALNNQEAICCLLRKGAFLGAKRQCMKGSTILTALMPATFHRAMDGCIYPVNQGGEENVLDPNYKLEMDCTFLVDPEISKDKPKNEMSTLLKLSESETLRSTLSHPLLRTLLFAKWRRVLPFYLLNLLLNLVFVILLTLFFYYLKDLRISETLLEQGVNLTEKRNETLKKDIEDSSVSVNILMGLLLPITFIVMAKEAVQIVILRRVRFKNLLDLFLIVVVLLMSFRSLGVESTRHLAAWAMILAWCKFVLLLGREPRLAIYITMLHHVSRNFAKLILLYSFLILAFTISFNIILQPDGTSTEQQDGAEEEKTDFGSFWSTLPKAIVMATGEFEYSDLNDGFSQKIIFSLSAVLVFLTFLFVIFLVLMNVMNGLAVTETQYVMEKALVHSLVSRIELIYTVESVMGRSSYFRDHLQFLSTTSPPVLQVNVNASRKGDRLIYGRNSDHKYHLDTDTTTALRNHRIEILEEEDQKRENDPMQKCLAYLEQLMASSSKPALPPAEGVRR